MFTWRITLPRMFGTDRQPSLIVDQLVVEELDHRVDHDGERDRRLVRVARVVRSPRWWRCGPARRSAARRCRRRSRRASCRSGRRSSCCIAGDASSSRVTSRDRSRSSGLPTWRISRTVTRPPTARGTSGCSRGAPSASSSVSPGNGGDVVHGRDGVHHVVAEEPHRRAPDAWSAHRHRRRSAA